MSASPGTIDFIEVYDGERYLSVHCARHPTYMAQVAARGEVEWAPSVERLLDETLAASRGRRVIVALGNSTSAGDHCWPRKLTQPPVSLPGESAPVVINLSEFGETAERGLSRVEEILRWPGLRAAAEVTFVCLTGILDVYERTIGYRRFVAGLDASAALESESSLVASRSSPAVRRVGRLVANVPFDEAEVPRWIAQRAALGMAALAEPIVRCGYRVFGILQPLCYDDLVASYQGGIRRLHLRSGSSLDFETWRRDRKILLDLDEFCQVPMRSTLDELRARWARAGAPGEIRCDWSAFFRQSHAQMYQANFDAVHYGALGHAALALGVQTLLRAGEPVLPEMNLIAEAEESPEWLDDRARFDAVLERYQNHVTATLGRSVPAVEEPEQLWAFAARLGSMEELDGAVRLDCAFPGRAEEPAKHPAGWMLFAIVNVLVDARVIGHIATTLVTGRRPMVVGRAHVPFDIPASWRPVYGGAGAREALECGK